MEKKKNYITPAGMKSLVDEQDNLLKIERPQILKVVTWAASLGDRSENADYQYAKRRLREIERRLRFLSKQIDSGVVIDPLDIKTIKIQFSSTVTVENDEGEIKVYSIVGTDETNSIKNWISWKSPISRSLLGKIKGDYVTVYTPSGEVEFRILKVEYLELV
ncbi:MAG: transcription elongation factor GreB [Bacteriovoracaceae bacterium]|nr:transcription elongation factor GreB [Bacteriovoracaceae bacterium]